MERHQRKAYDKDITDEQWKEIEPLYAGMRNRIWSKRELTNALLYINKAGYQWRNLPSAPLIADSDGESDVLHR